MTDQKTGTIEGVDPQVRNLSACEAALALARSGQKDRALRVLVAMSRTGDSIVRVRAAECMMEVGGERAVMGLFDLLADRNPQVRLTAIGALGALRVHSACDRLMNLLKSDPEIPVRVMAARTLGKLGNKAGLSLIIRLLDVDNDYYSRLAVMALRDIIGQRFSPTQEGVKSAKRYMSVNLKRILAGG